MLTELLRLSIQMKQFLSFFSDARLIGVSLLLGIHGQAFSAPIAISQAGDNAIEINESFRNFYSFADGTPWSANTGYEQANTLTAFFAEYQAEQALFLIFSGPGGLAGGVDFDIVGSQGRISFVDDPIRTLPDGSRVPRDPVVGSNVSMNYVENYTDGLIYSGLTSQDWSINIDFNSSYGLDGFRFLGFDGQGNDTVMFEQDSLPSSLQFINTARSVSTPSILMLLLIGMVFAFTRNSIKRI